MTVQFFMGFYFLCARVCNNYSGKSTVWNGNKTTFFAELFLKGSSSSSGEAKYFENIQINMIFYLSNFLNRTGNSSFSLRINLFILKKKILKALKLSPKLHRKFSIKLLPKLSPKVQQPKNIFAALASNFKD